MDRAAHLMAARKQRGLTGSSQSQDIPFKGMSAVALPPARPPSIVPLSLDSLQVLNPLMD
jgi:hypothetical protein